MTGQQLLTPHQSQYFAWLLTRRAAGDSVESLASTLVDSQVDLNPHQVEAALFACRNPLSRGVILADEVGLGKTIEAGLVLSQRWAERRRKVLIIVPANLRKQWHQELQDKFGLQGLILEAKSYNAIRTQEQRNVDCKAMPVRAHSNAAAWVLGESAAREEPPSTSTTSTAARAGPRDRDRKFSDVSVRQARNT